MENDDPKILAPSQIRAQKISAIECPFEMKGLRVLANLII